MITLQACLEKIRHSLLEKISEMPEQAGAIQELYQQFQAAEAQTLQLYYDLKSQEAALLEKERRFNTVIANTPIIIYGFDNKGVFTVFEGLGVQKIGMQPGQLIGSSIFSMYGENHPVTTKLKDVLAGEPVSAVSTAGGYFFEYHSEPLRDETGTIIGVTGVAVDVTERQKAEMERNAALESLRASETNYRLVANNVHDIIYTTDLAGHLTFVTPSTLTVMGYQPTEVLGRMAAEFAAPEFVKPIQGIYESTREYGQSEQLIEPRTIEVGLMHKNGNRFAAEISYSGLVDEGGNTIGVVGVIRNIEERKRMQQELLAVSQANARMEQLMSIATMAAGVIHEINQPLNAIKLISSGIVLMHQRGRLETVDQYDEDLREISAQADRIKRILDHLKSFSRKDAKNRRPISVNAAVVQALAFLNAQLVSHGISVNTCLEEKLPPVLAVPEALEEIVINLVVNAIQALEKTNLGERHVKLDSWFDGQVKLRISDTGPGVPSKIQDKIFEPFISTKQGTDNLGMGLAIVRNMVISYGGTIELVSEPTGGAAFVISFPAAL